MQKYLVVFYFLFSVCYATEDKDTSAWLKDELKEMLLLNQKQDLPTLMNKCTAGIAESPDSKLLVFVSFSMPDATLLDLANEVNQAGGIFVIRGLPENSFKALAQKMLGLLDKGLKVSIQINPTFFQKYEIEKVPTFVLLGENDYDKVSGNISLEYALRLFSEGSH
jgi:conjugal transfer pilus assembly protein TrbC